MLLTGHGCKVITARAATDGCIIGTYLTPSLIGANTLTCCIRHTIGRNATVSVDHGSIFGTIFPNLDVSCHVTRSKFLGQSVLIGLTNGLVGIVCSLVTYTHLSSSVMHRCQGHSLRQGTRQSSSDKKANLCGAGGPRPNLLYLDPTRIAPIACRANIDESLSSLFVFKLVFGLTPIDKILERL